MMDTLTTTRDRCDAVGGNLVGGRVLHTLVRWQNFTKVWRDDYFWVTMSRQQWAKETNLSLDQIKRTMARLDRNKVIIRERHFFKNKITSYVRLSDAGKQALCTSHSLQDCANRTTQNCTDQNNFLQKELEETNKEAPAAAVAVPTAGSDEQVFEEASKRVKELKTNILGSSKTEHVPLEIDQGGSTLTGPAGIATAHSKDRYATKTKAKIDTMKPDLPATLIAVWREEYKALGLPPAVFNWPEKASLKALLEAIPAGTGPEFIRTAVRRWADVVEIAESDFGAFKSPTHPVFVTACKYAPAVQLVMAKAAKKISPAPVQSLAVGKEGANIATNPSFLAWQAQHNAKKAAK
jgi:hypothetical protein